MPVQAQLFLYAPILRLDLLLGPVLLEAHHKAGGVARHTDQEEDQGHHADNHKGRLKKAAHDVRSHSSRDAPFRKRRNGLHRVSALQAIGNGSLVAVLVVGIYPYFKFDGARYGLVYSWKPKGPPVRAGPLRRDEPIRPGESIPVLVQSLAALSGELLLIQPPVQFASGHQFVMAACVYDSTIVQYQYLVGLKYG